MGEVAEGRGGAEKLGTLGRGVIYVRPNWIKGCVINVRCRVRMGEKPKMSASHSQNLDWPSRADRGGLDKIYHLRPGTGERGDAIKIIKLSSWRQNERSP